jgi:hypothetical protein
MYLSRKISCVLPISKIIYSLAESRFLTSARAKNLGLPSLSTAKTRSSNKSIIQLYKTDLKPLLAIFGTAMRAETLMNHRFE